MYEFRCVPEGIFYYDPVLRTDMFAPNTLLFLIGYSRVFGDIHVSDKLYLPHVILDANGNTVALPNYTFSLSARAYLTQFSSVEVLDTGDLFELYGLPLVLEQIGFFNFYKSTNGYNTHLNRVPHVPLFTKRSQDYKRIINILTNKDYWGEGLPSKGLDELYSVYNPQGDRAESLELYNSFGSVSYIDTVLYPTELKPVGSYKDYCSWFIWDSLSFPQLYQFSAGVLYGMSQLSWGLLPYSKRPTEYAPFFKYRQLVDEAFFWFQNTSFDNTSTNDLINVDPSLFRINTVPLEGLRVGVTTKVEPGTVVLRTKYLWGYDLQLSYYRIVEGGVEYFYYCAETTPQNADTNISNTQYHQEILDSQCIETIRFYKGLTPLITKEEFTLTRVPEYLSGYPSDIEIRTRGVDFNVPSYFEGVNFIAEPRDSWSLGSVIDLPVDLYSIDEEGNVTWNLEHPLYTLLYGIEFTEVEQETETVIVYNSSMEELEVEHSLVTDLYYYNNEWITEEELNDYGWYVDRDLRVLRALSSTIDQEVEYSMLFDLYSVDGGETWIDSTSMRNWLDENNAEIVTGTITLYEGYTQLDLPVSAWFI